MDLEALAVQRNTEELVPGAKVDPAGYLLAFREASGRIRIELCPTDEHPGQSEGLLMPQTARCRRSGPLLPPTSFKNQHSADWSRLAARRVPPASQSQPSTFADVYGGLRLPMDGEADPRVRPTDIRTADRSPYGKGYRGSGPRCRHPVRIERCRRRDRPAVTRTAMRSRWGREGCYASRAEAESDLSVSGLPRIRLA